MVARDLVLAACNQAPLVLACSAVVQIIIPQCATEEKV